MARYPNRKQEVDLKSIQYGFESHSRYQFYFEVLSMSVSLFIALFVGGGFVNILLTQAIK